MNDLDMPLLYPVRQKLYKTSITNLELYFRDVIENAGYIFRDICGKKVGVCVGSRGISNLSMLIKILVSYLKDKGAEPIIIPCMGSHGGATAEGQESLIVSFGITGINAGAKVSSSLDVTDIGPTRGGFRAYMDTTAASCDLLVMVNRIKEHTDFTSELESGIIKMLAIGLGNHIGASYIHSYGSKGLIYYIPDIAAKIIESKFIIGVGIIEDGYSQTDRVEVMSGNEILAKEKELLKYSKKIKAKIPFKKVNYLIIEEMGKEISGSGMDTKVIGRIRYQGVEEPVNPSPDIITCLRLTPGSHGNAAGVGLADIISKKLYDSIDFGVTYVNGRTTMCPERYKVPMYLDDDRTAVLTGLEFARTSGTFGNKVVFIKSTRFLEKLLISESLLDEAIFMDNMEVISSQGIRIPFSDNGEYLGMFEELV